MQPACEVTVLRNATSASARFDSSGEGGRVYELESVDIRQYARDLATEPTTAPDFEFLKEYGNRNGYSLTLPCSGRFVIHDVAVGTFTAFVDVALVSRWILRCTEPSGRFVDRVNHNQGA